MQIKWQRQKANNGLNGHPVQLIAVLVEQYRKAGQTKERCIEELGSIKEPFLTIRALDARAFHQGLFWAAVDQKLDSLALSPEVRNGIEQQILKEVPRPGGDWALWGVTCIPRYV